jgi:KipI family sensor histidine kinase inhibitor
LLLGPSQERRGIGDHPPVILPRPRLEPLGDRALLLVVGDRVDAAVNAAARRLQARLAAAIGDDVVWLVGMASVALLASSPLVLPELRRRLQRALASLGADDAPPDIASGRRIDLAVRYGGADGPDLDAVAAHAGLDAAGTVAAHAGGDYTVACIGFQPGFPYLLGLDPRLAMPRRAVPRSAVAAGSVGIGGAQTGIYPSCSPGGWQLIGRIAERLFDPRRTPASLLAVGDRVRFRVADAAAFAADGEREMTDARREADSAATDATSAAVVEVIHAGTLTMVQDQGRNDHRAIGVAPGGAADPAALAVANLLVGNAETAAGLEILLRGPRLRFADARVVVWLGDAEVSVQAGDLAIPRGRPVRLPAGSELVVGTVRNGLRIWLAISGGIAVAPVLGSRATDLRGGFGGFDGRALAVGDRLPLGASRLRPRRSADEDVARLLGWGARLESLPSRDAAVELRVLAGAHAPALGREGRDTLAGAEWIIGNDSDRMGLRLRGAALFLAGVGELPSAAALPGTVQLPPGGQPVILAVDGQTLGGYPRIAHVIDADLARLAQLGPGARVRLRWVDDDEALALDTAAAIARQRAREGARQVAALEFGT